LFSITSTFRPEPGRNVRKVGVPLSRPGPKVRIPRKKKIFGAEVAGGCGFYGKGGCGDYGLTQQCCRARLLVDLPGVLVVVLTSAPLGVRPKPNFHRANNRNLGGGIQGCVYGGLSRGLRAAEGFSGAVEFWVVVRGQGEKSKPEPFTHPRVRHPREFRSCFRWIPVPRGRVGHPPIRVCGGAVERWGLAGFRSAGVPPALFGP
jgi:hypothetical protein